MTACRVSGHAERLAALDMVAHWADRLCAITLGTDRGYDAADFVEERRGINVRPHVAQNDGGRRSAVDRGRPGTGYAESLRIRKRIEEAFGWIKTVAGLALDQAQRPSEGGLSLHLRRHRLPARS